MCVKWVSLGVWGERTQFDRQNPGSMARQRTLESEGEIYRALNRGNYRANVSGGLHTRR
jgi:hypothetical protein